MSDQLSFSRNLGFAVQRITPFQATDLRVWYEWLVRPADVEADAFIDAVESLGECMALDRTVIRTSLRWLSRQSIDTRLSVNIFASSISQREFLDFVVDEIVECNVSPEQICFEITEHQAINNLASATRFARMLRTLGSEIALDDIGSGNMHMGMLNARGLVDYLKVDRCWVTPALHSETHRKTLTALVEFGRRAGIDLVLEGVETDEHLRMAGEFGVAYYQGYVDGLPLPVTLDDRPATETEHEPAVFVTDSWLQTA